MCSIAHISELLELICEFADRHTLVRLARSSRVLHEPAIQVLWSVLPNLLPLIMRFPEDAWEIEQKDMDFFVLSITRTLVPEEWTSFLKYSSLVRVLGQDSRPFSSPYCRRWSWTYIIPSYDLWDVLCAYRPTPLLFPRLRVLIWDSLKLRRVHLASFLLSVGENVQEIRISHSRFLLEDEDSAKAQEDAVNVIVDRFPRLRRLDLYPQRRDHNAHDPMLSIASALTSITSLECGDMSEAAFIALAQLKTLAELTLHLSDDATWPQMSSLFATEQPFPRLLFLKPSGTLRAYVSFGNAVQLPTVRIVSIDLRPLASDPTQASTLCATIRQQFCPQALTTLHMTSTLSSGEPITRTTLDAVHLRPFLAFRRMENLVLYAPCRLAIDDALLLDMSAAWPALRKLTLRCYSPCDCDGHTNPTLYALPSLASRCPRLQEVELYLRANCWASDVEFARDDALGDVYAELKNTQSQSRVHTLNVGSSPITAPNSVAQFLSRIFPSLARVEYSRRAGFFQVATRTTTGVAAALS
ncbi:hypothetical protein C8Q73DRAFT_700760 [Cubamyces lactineus]|nr:hypothetical protein C8Q73DRAFT_700760 [Cubamyces lactineus]